MPHEVRHATHPPSPIPHPPETRNPKPETGPLRALLIVNGDDFGISEGVNLGIVEAHERGVLTSTTVMANMPCFEHAASLAADHPALGVGIHLNLTAGSPVLPPERVPGLVRRDGRLLPLGAVLRGLTSGGLDLSQVEAELAAQVERALRDGIRPTHLDSHHHVHMHPRIHGIVIRLAQRFGIRGIRCTSELGPGDALARVPMLLEGRPRPGAAPPAEEASSGQANLEGRSASPEPVRAAYLKAVALSLFGAMLRRRLRAAGLAAPDRFRGAILGTAFALEDLLRTLRGLPAGSVELMCHPGHVDAALRQRTSYARGRDRELAALLDPSARAVLHSLGVRLGTYRDL